MNKLITQPLSLRRSRWTLLQAMLAVLLGFCATPSDAQTWTIGTGTSTYPGSGTPISPLGYYYPQVRVQYLYDTAAMRVAGMPVGGGPVPIHQIAFNVGNLNSATKARNYQISMMGTTVTGLPTGTMINGLPVVYSTPVGYQPSTGWNVINLSTPFMWNGTDNIIVEVCFTDGSTSLLSGGQAGVYYHSTTGGPKSTYITGTGTGSLCTLPGSTPSGNTTNRPNIRFTRLFPCTGASAAPTTSPSGTTNAICPGFSATIVSSGYTAALNTRFQWWTSSTATGPWVHARGDSSSDRYTTPPMIANTYYRLTVTCMNTGDSVLSSVVGFTTTGGFPVYASLPYFESFENWSNGCATNDKVSSNNWTNIPITGNASWRRDDQGSSASWTTGSPAPGKAYDGTYFAKHNGYSSTAPNEEGNLSLYFNASATTGNKDLSFYYRFDYPSAGNYDSLNVELSTDGGLTFSNIGKYGTASNPVQTWNFIKINIATTSATSVVRFRARALSTYKYGIDIDAVRIDPPCTGKPNAGIIDTNVQACKGVATKLGLLGDTKAAGLSYLWQVRNVGGSSWTPLAGGNVPNPTVTLTTPMDFRCIVTCTYSVPNVSDTTPVYRVNLAPFYYCYCKAQTNPSYVTYPSYVEVGNVTIKTEPAGTVLLNNGNALPTTSNPNTFSLPYEDFRTKVAAPVLIRDSTYRIMAAQTAGQSYFYTGCYGAAWMDANRDGVFQSTEQIMYKSIPSQTNPIAQTTFTIGSAAPTGLTGLRVIVQYYTPVNPCGNTVYYGQVEDYLVRIEYQPCTGPVNPGTASISDTAVCRGYTVDLYDTSYERARTNIQRMWEVSTNGGASFSAIPGSAQKDTMPNVVVTAASQYRLRVICGPSGDTTYSNVVSVNTPDPVRCYPTSWAFPGGGNDSSDVGAVILGETLVNPPAGTPAGPHLLNPAATKRRSDFTLLKPTELHADSTYRLAVFHTMPRGFHKDALVSVYLDFNNDGDFDLSVPPPPFTSELIFQGVTAWDSFFLDTKIKIPSAVIPNMPTGMRVIVNNDTNPYGPGNTGSGNFTSGEVEDYVVIFRRSPLNVPGAAVMQNLVLFPNPTSGKFTVAADAIRPIRHIEVTVSTMAGQTVMTRSFDNVGTRFNADLDLADQAKGVYFVELRADGEKINKKLIVR